MSDTWDKFHSMTTKRGIRAYMIRENIGMVNPMWTPVGRIIMECSKNNQFRCWIQFYGWEIFPGSWTRGGGYDKGTAAFTSALENAKRDVVTTDPQAIRHWVRWFPILDDPKLDSSNWINVVPANYDVQSVL